MKLSSPITSCLAVTAAVVACGELAAKAQYVIYQAQPVVVEHRPVVVRSQPVVVQKTIYVEHRQPAKVQSGIRVRTAVPGMSFSIGF